MGKIDFYCELKDKEVIECIFNNKNSSYDELMSKLKKIGVNRYSYLKIILDRIEEYNKTVVYYANIIIKHLKNKDKGIVDEEVENEFNKIKNFEFETPYIYKPNRNQSNFKFERKPLDYVDPNIERARTIALMRINGYTDEEIKEKVNISPKTFDVILSQYLYKSPEEYAKYIIYSKNLEKYDYEKAKEIKERVNFYLSNLEKNSLNLTSYTKDRKQYNDYVARLNRYYKIYRLVLSCLDFKEKATPNILPGVEQDIVDFCNNITQIMINENKFEKKIKNNETSNTYKINLELVKKVYYRELNLIRPEEKGD